MCVCAAYQCPEDCAFIRGQAGGLQIQVSYSVFVVFKRSDFFGACVIEIWRVYS